MTAMMMDIIVRDVNTLITATYTDVAAFPNSRTGFLPILSARVPMVNMANIDSTGLVIITLSIDRNATTHSR